MTMQFRHKDKNKRGTSILVNGKMYLVNDLGIVTVDDDAAIAKLRKFDEFVALSGLEDALSVPPPLKPKGAIEFVALYASDERVRKRLDTIKDDKLKLSFARALGFDFTEKELADAMKDAASPSVPTSAPAPAPVEEKPPAPPKPTRNPGRKSSAR